MHSECMFHFGASFSFILCYCIFLILFTFLPEVLHETFLHRGGFGGSQSLMGEDGTVSGKACPKGLYGIFCEVVHISCSLFHDNLMVHCSCTFTCLPVFFYLL